MLKFDPSNNTFTINTTDDVIQYFKKSNIFLAYPWKTDNIYKPNDILRFKKNCAPEQFSNMPRHRVITLGAFSYCRTVNIDPDFTAGRYCSIATEVSLSDQEHPLDRVSTHPFTTHKHMVTLAETYFAKTHAIEPFSMLGPAPVIENDVWIGKGAVLKRGIKIGTGAVIGANSFVTKDVPPYA